MVQKFSFCHQGEKDVGTGLFTQNPVIWLEDCPKSWSQLFPNPTLTMVLTSAALGFPQSHIGLHGAGKADGPEKKGERHTGLLPRALPCREPSHPRHLAWVDIFTFWASFSRAMSSP